MKKVWAVCLLAAAFAACHAYVAEDMTDPAIKARVIHHFKADPELDLSKVDVDVHAGVVTLSGIARSEEQREKMRRIAAHQHGVDQVDVNLFVAP
ncbi:MAG: BON domain-containing protein [Elusimicrobia bacterium]|nr:BON domain-containing protein [Elusimicrobiota bacterium]